MSNEYRASKINEREKDKILFMVVLFNVVTPTAVFRF